MSGIGGIPAKLRGNDFGSNRPLAVNRVLRTQAGHSGQHRIEAQVDHCLMTWGYSMHLGKRPFILPILQTYQFSL